MIFRSTPIVEFKQWTENLFRKQPRRLLGFALGFVAFVRSDVKQHTIKHELVHIKQFWRTFGLHLLFYNISKSYRFKTELEAYVESVKNGRSVESAAGGLSVHVYKRDTYEDKFSYAFKALNTKLQLELD